MIQLNWLASLQSRYSCAKYHSGMTIHINTLDGEIALETKMIKLLFRTRVCKFRPVLIPRETFPLNISMRLKKNKIVQRQIG